MIDLDTLLYGNPSWPEVVEFFKDGEFYTEDYNIAAIEKHLQTEEQRKLMFDNRFSINAALNGRIMPSRIEIRTKIFKEWNKKLGFQCFRC